jgi:signal transduction histidine kinase
VRVLSNVLRSLWNEPRVPNPPRRVWRDWALVGTLELIAVLEGLFAPDVVWRPVALPVAMILLAPLLWRRTHPLPSVAVTFGGIALLDIATLLAGRDSASLFVMIGTVVFPYALFRWGSGKDAAVGFVLMALPHVMNMIYYPSPAETTAAGFAFLLFPSALGASVRFRAKAREREIDEVKLLEREQLARELHDTVAHHVSAIVIQAQAGRAMASSNPEAARTVLETIEAEASRTLGEMRSMVGVLRRGEAQLVPQRGIADLDQLAANRGGKLAVELDLRGDLAGIHPTIQAAIYRLAQEAITNARRHARNATRVTVRLVGDGDTVSLTVGDNGDATHFDRGGASGYGLVGMEERAVLHGGTFAAGPNNGRGWTVRATLPRGLS